MYICVYLLTYVCSLYECNHSSAEPIVSDEAFANPSLEAIDVIAEYDAYIRNMSENVSNSVFNFCRYSFLLPINMKRKLLAYDVNKSIFNSVCLHSSYIRASVGSYMYQYLCTDELLRHLYPGQALHRNTALRRYVCTHTFTPAIGTKRVFVLTR